MTYKTPVRDMVFTLDHMAGFAALEKSGAYEDLNRDLVEAVLGECAKLADDVFAPLNRQGDVIGAALEKGEVTTPPGFANAYQAYVEGGWNSLAFPAKYGGQGLPQSLALSVFDAFCGGCLGLSMGFSLTTGAVKALLSHGSPEQKEIFLPKLVSGEWTGTMNLTEPQAGSDLSDMRTKAEPLGDGRYKISGNKIFISYGEHDMAKNICHLVLARLPGAPEGTRGISMFLVPKYHVGADGALGERNDIICTGIEHKMGQHGSPTCSLSFGDKGECIGTLVGNPHEGLKNMFVMMNAARIDVGMQSVSVAERALQTALQWAGERQQGRAFGVKTGPQIAIIGHPDVRRMLYLMKANTMASRGLCYANMVAWDLAHVAEDEAARKAAKEREELLTPLAKAWSSDRANETTSLGVQIHGGMGFVEETGAAQNMRDVRICSIYEGTNGIQAIDLVGRKLGMGKGKLVYDFLDDIRANASALKSANKQNLQAMGAAILSAADEVEKTTKWVVEAMRQNPEDGLAGASAYQEQLGDLAGGHFLAKGALAAAQKIDQGEDDYLQSNIAIADFYNRTCLGRVHSLSSAITAGSEALPEIKSEFFVG
jgi:3-(methylsulfanyl)propanoyl-CoA dehydrogenase